ncbi:MAG: PAS domain S-box protein [Candidatus Acidiferrum sp.]
MIQTGAPLVGSYDYAEVARSILIAIAASYAALDLGGRVTAAHGRARAAWLAGGAIAMGLGIWTMHFKGMVAFRLPVPVAYQWPTVLLSVLAAILGSAVALFVASRKKMGWVRALVGSLLMGFAIAGMHYLGMAAMRLSAVRHYNPWLVAASVLIAIAASVVALEFTFDYREDFRGTSLAKFLSAVWMGAAICLMHYTGMAAVSFFPTTVVPNLSHTVSISPLGNNGIVIVTLLFLGTVILTSSMDRQTQVECQRLNERLEHRVVERTRQLTAANEELHREMAERERAQDGLRRSEDRLRLVLDTTPALIHSARPDGYFDYFNQRWLEYVGLSLEHVQGWAWTTVIHPEDLEGIVAKWRACLATGEPFLHEARIRRADGEYRCMLNRKVPLRDEHGNIVKWYGSGIDIEDRKQVEEQLKREQTYLAMAQRMARMGVWSWNPSSGDMFGSEEFCRIFEIEPDKANLTREVFLRRIHLEDLSRYEAEVNAAVAERRNWELDYRIVIPNASVKYVHAIGKPVFDKSGDLLEFVGTTLDITERKRAEQELRQAQEHMHAILENSSNLIFLKDTEGRYLRVNREFQRALRVSQEQIKDKTDSEIFPPEQAAVFRANDLEVLRAGVAMEFEEIATHEDGPHTSIVHKFPLFDTHGNIYATGGVATDITERKRAEEARRYSEEQYRTVVETATDAVISIDEASQILFVNPATTKVFGYDRSELIGRPLTTLIPDSLRKLHEAGFRRYLATGQRHLNWQGAELTGLRKNGQEFPVEVSFGEMISNGHKVFTGFIRDISLKKRADDELRKQKEVFQKIFENIPATIAFIGQDGHLELVNPEWERTLGWTLEEIRKQNLDLLADFYPDPDYRKKMRDLIAASTGEWTDRRVRAKDGRVIDLVVAVVHLSDGSSIAIGRDITERKRAEQSLLLFRMLIDQSNDAIEVIDPETLRFIDINGRACLDLGYSREELLSLSVYDVDPVVDELMLARVAGKLENSGSAVFESFHRRKDGSTFPVEVSIKQVRLDRVYRVSVVRDITERKRTEESLRSAAEFDEAALKSLGEGLYTIDINGLVTSMNPAAEELFGWSFAELRGKKMHEMVHHHYPDGRPFPSSECAGFQVLTHGQALKNYEDVFICKDGTFFDVVYSIAPMRDAAGQINSLVVVFRDITERKRAEAELRESEARFRLVADSAPVMIWMSGTDKLCTYLNKPWLDFTGRSLEQELGNGWAEAVNSEDLQRCLDTYTQAFDRREGFTMEYRLRRHDGEYRWVSDIGVPRFNPDESFAGYIGSCVDITERMRAEEELQRLSGLLLRLQDEERRRIARDLHDSTGQDLVALATMLGQLWGSLPSGELKPRRLLSKCRTLADQCIRQIRTLSYVLYPPMLDKAGLVDAIRDYVKGFSTRSGIYVELEPPADLGRMAPDVELALFRVVQEALTNIQLHSGSQQAKIRIDRNSELTLEISDQGHGTSAGEPREREVPRFKVGVGISSMQERVKLIGGRLEIDSTRHGTTVRVAIPLERNEREKAAYSGG